MGNCVLADCLDSGTMSSEDLCSWPLRGLILEFGLILFLIPWSKNKVYLRIRLFIVESSPSFSHLASTEHPVTVRAAGGTRPSPWHLDVGFSGWGGSGG